MATTSNDITTQLSALFKEIYAPTLKWLMPKGLKFQNDFEFVPEEQQPGGNYNQPVVVKHEHGFSYKRAGVDGDDWTLLAASAGKVANAQVVGAQMILQSGLGYEAASRGSSGGKRAYVAATKYLVENMWQSTKKRLEIELATGQSGLGSVASVDSTTLTMTTADWAPGFWAGMEGAAVDFYEPAFASRDVQTTISSLSIANRTITVAAATSVTGSEESSFKDQITANATPASVVYDSMVGLRKILTNTGTLFGISASSYSVWQGNTTGSIGSVNLAFEDVQRLVALLVGKGAEGDLVLYVNPMTWATLLSDQAALRRHGDPNKSTKYTLGSENIEFYSQIGKVTIKASIYVPEGYAWLLNPADFRRVGSNEPSFRLKDRGDEYFFHDSTYATYRMRTYTNQALFCEAPGRTGYISGISNS